jgi:hypothetical protein
VRSLIGLFPVVTIVALSSGCDRSTPSAASVRRDSAGTTIIETPIAQRRAAPITIVEGPSVSIGQIEGDARYLLSRVVGALQLPDGNIVIANGGTNELRFFDPTGKWLKSEGRTGAGPGEYEYLRALGKCRAPGFAAFDLHWQLNSYDAAGTFIEKSALRAPNGISPYNLACDEHGHLLILGWGHPAKGIPIGFYSARDRLVLASSDGTIRSDFGQRLVSERIGNEHGSRPHPAGRATLFALANDLVYVGSGERFELELYDLGAKLRTLVRGPAIPLSTTDSVKAAYLQSTLARVSPDRQPALRNEIANMQWPETLPAYTKMIVDPNGIAWVRAFQLDPSASETWSLLDPERGYIGDLSLRAGQSLLEAGRDYLLVLNRDSLDVESVRRLRLNRPAQPSS